MQLRLVCSAKRLPIRHPWMHDVLERLSEAMTRHASGVSVEENGEGTFLERHERFSPRCFRHAF